jgi:hypothetical protein
MSYYSSTVMNDSPVAYYRLDEASGTTAIDASGNGYTGTYSGSGVTYGVAGALSNDADTSVTFNGSSGDMAMPAGVDPSTFQSLSVEFWLKLSTLSLSSQPAIIANDAPGTSNKGFVVYLNSTGSAIILKLGNGSSSTTSTLNYPFATGVWYHIVWTWNGTNIAGYVNGVVKENDNTFGGPIASTTNHVTVGHNPAGTDWLTGSVDEVAIYNTTLSAARILAHFQAASLTFSSSIFTGAVPSGSILDLHTQKIQVCRVFDPYGNFLGVWPDAPHITGLKDTVNCAQGQVKMVLPRAIDNFTAVGQVSGTDTIALGNQVQVWIYGPGLPTSGLLKFNGFIDIIEPAITEAQQQSVTVTLTPYSAVFGDHGYGANLQFTGIDPVKLFQYWFTTIDPITGAPYTDPMVWAAGNPTSSGTVANYLIQNQDLKSIADAVLAMLGYGWFWRPNPDNTVTLAQVASTAQHTFLLGQHMASMSYSLDQTPRKNVIYFVGKGVTAIAKGPSARPPKSGGIGERILFQQDSRITDQTSANIVANALLTVYDIPQIRAKFRLVDYRGDTSGLGYDIEALKVGETGTVLNARGHSLASLWGSFIWGKDAYASAGAGQVLGGIAPIVALTYGWSYVDVELGWLAPRQDRQIFAIRRSLRDYTVGT